MDTEHKIKEYELLQKLELETTKIRHTTFTTLLSISFLIPSFSVDIKSFDVQLMGETVPINKLVFLLGFVFYIFSVFHYNWYHRYSHKYRKRLKDIEKEIGFEIYKNRVRPVIGKKFKMHFDWTLYIIGGLYGYITANYVGLLLFTIIIGTMIAIYGILVLLSFRQPIEPLEES
jgi:hypothetical protein